MSDAPLFGLEGALEVNPHFHLLGTFGYAPGTDSYLVSNQSVDLFEYDVGFELDAVKHLANETLFKPFIGVGGGGRSYDYRSGDLARKVTGNGYGAVGTEFQFGRTALRFEGRYNYFGFPSPLVTSGQNLRQDVNVNIGLAFHLR